MDHLRIFFTILRSVPLNDNIESVRALRDFDFKKFSFETHGGVSASSYAGRELLMQNLGSRRLRLLRPSLLRNLWASFLSVDVRYYTIGHGEKRALVKIEEKRFFSVEPYSPRLFKKWVKQLP